MRCPTVRAGLLFLQQRAFSSSATPELSIKGSKLQKIAAQAKRGEVVAADDDFSSAAATFRTDYSLPAGIDLKKWYPHHMDIGLSKMQARLRRVDCIIEVHDARIPFTGRNPDFLNSLYAIRPHVLLLNKVDLIDKAHCPRVERALKAQGVKHVLWTNFKHHTWRGLDQMMQLVLGEMAEAPRYNRHVQTDFNLMVVGVPNVGKSSMINMLRHRFTGKKGRATVVGPQPGVTRTVLEKIRIHETPPVFVFDTPGVLYPSAPTAERTMKLALVDAIPRTFIGPEQLADFLLYWCNKNRNYSYIPHLHLQRPSDNIEEVLLHLCKVRQMERTVNFPAMGPKTIIDFTAAACFFLEFFKTKKLGDQFLDLDVIGPPRPPRGRKAPVAEQPALATD